MVEVSITRAGYRRRWTKFEVQLQESNQDVQQQRRTTKKTRWGVVTSGKKIQKFANETKKFQERRGKNVKSSMWSTVFYRTSCMSLDEGVRWNTMDHLGM